jgi:excisionase family DNA binding protein
MRTTIVARHRAEQHASDDDIVEVRDQEQAVLKVEVGGRHRHQHPGSTRNKMSRTPIDANLSYIEKNFRCSVPEGLSQDPYIEVFLRIVRIKQIDWFMVRHLWPNQRFTTSNSRILANMPQIACWGKTNEHDGYKTSFTSDDIRLDDLPEAVTYLCISKGMLRHWVSDRKIEFVKLGRAVRFRKAHLDRFISQKLQKKHSRG